MGQIKDIIEFICAAGFATFRFLLPVKTGKVVLCYHYLKIGDVEQFERQMHYLAQRCDVVLPSEIFDADGNDGRMTVAITFDDAFFSIYERAIDILKKYELPAGVFVPSGNPGKLPGWQMPEDSPYRDETVMDAEAIGDMDKDGFEMLSHTVSHCVLTELSDEQLNEELSKSKDDVQRIIGHEVCGISYPHGECDSRVCEAAEKAGYTYGFTLEPCMVDCAEDRLQIGRFVVSPGDSLMKFKLKVTGAYQVIRYLRAIKKMITGAFQYDG